MISPSRSRSFLVIFCGHFYRVLGHNLIYYTRLYKRNRHASREAFALFKLGEAELSLLLPEQGFYKGQMNVGTYSGTSESTGGRFRKATTGAGDERLKSASIVFNTIERRKRVLS